LARAALGAGPQQPAGVATGRTIGVVADVGEPTLPDLLADGLSVMFVGINQSRFSVSRGYYFARPGNRF
jgi:double-stranded uracil-DNA glycosylase